MLHRSTSSAPPPGWSHYEEYHRASRRYQRYNSKQLLQISNDQIRLLNQLFQLSDRSEADPMVQTLIDEFRHQISRYWYPCCLEHFEVMGQDYLNNPHFQRKINHYGSDLAQFIGKAIGFYVQQRQNL